MKFAAPSSASKSLSRIMTGSPRDEATAAIHRSLIRIRRPRVLLVEWTYSKRALFLCPRVFNWLP